MSTDPGTWRISDLDRDNAARLLGTAMEQGRITPTEYSDRCQAAYAARTRDELVAVLADLPGGPPPELGPLVLDVAFGQVQRTGRWPVPELVRITGNGQRTVLDLTQAHLQRPEVVIEVTATLSFTDLLLPAHARVDTDRLELVAGSVRHRTISTRRRGRGWWPEDAVPGEQNRRGGLRRRGAREEPAPLDVALRGRAALSTVTLWYPKSARRR